MIDFLSFIKNKENLLAASTNEAQPSPVAPENKASILMSEEMVHQKIDLSAFASLETKPETKVQTNSIFPTAAKPQVEEIKTPPVKTSTGETTDGYFSRYYTKYNKADAEGKVKFIKKYFGSLTAAQQEKEFERLRRKGVSPEEIERLAKSIGALNAKNQLKAEDAVMNKGSEKLNRAGRKAVAETIQEYDKTVQEGATKLLVNTKDETAIKIGAGHASECDVKAQTNIVKVYQQIEDKDVNKILIDQYGKFAKENEIPIHTIMSNSKLSETVEYAASNIWKFDKANQKSAVQITIDTGNEAAINAAAAKANYYDKSVQSEIKSTLSDSGYQSVKETLATTEKVEMKPSESATPASSVADKIKEIVSSNSAVKESEIKNILKNASNAEKLALISSLPPGMLYPFINALLEDNPSMAVLSEITKIMGQVDSKNQTSLIKKMNNSYSSSILNSKVSLFDSALQTMLVKEAAYQGNLQSINKKDLSSNAKEVYTELLS